MSLNMKKFSNAVYHISDRYDFGLTEFSRRELKVLFLVNGKRSVSEISDILSSDCSTLMPDFAKLVRLGLIQTEGAIVSAGVSELIFNEYFSPPDGYTIARMPKGVNA